jgi:hypothetical protein
VRKWNVKFGKGVGYRQVTGHKQDNFNTLKAELNPICHLLALLGAHLILHVSRIRVKKIWTYFQWEIKQYGEG